MNVIDSFSGPVLQGKVAIITGAGSGIGKATVEVFTKRGAKVVAADIDLDAVNALKEAFPDCAENIYPFKADVSNEQEAEAMVDYAINECGRFDILFNNAGVMDSMQPLTLMPIEVWERCMKVNVYGVMYASKKALRYFLDNNIEGCIINTASVGGLHGARAGAAYTVSKHAVVGLTKNIAFMYAERGIRCNAIAPGGIATNIGKSMGIPNEIGWSRVKKGIEASDRQGDPYEVAGAALYLCSSGSSYVNGVILPVDGGWTAY